jgi:methionine-rich copper-binding protein CopC
MTRSPREVGNPWAVVLALALALLVLPGVASAHATPDHADPKVGSTVSKSPTQVRIWFDSEIEPAFSSIEVHGAGGATVQHGKAQVDPSDPKLLQVAIPQELAAATYRVTWSVVARDGHRTSGEYAFTIK